MRFAQRKYRLFLRGVFRFEDPQGRRLPIRSRRAMALIAMLATARNGERSRAWLQDHLWGSRAAAQGKASLRRELSNLRPLLNTAPEGLLDADHERVVIDLDQILVDVADPRLPPGEGQFLEGLNIAGEEGFEDWLREWRTRLADPDSDGAAIPSHAAMRAIDAAPAISIIPVGASGREARLALQDGVVGTLVDRIARLRWLTVVMAPSPPLPHPSPFHLRQLGHELSVDYLLLCELPRGDRLTLTLCTAQEAKVLWSDRQPIAAAPDDPGLEQALQRVVAALGAKIETDQQIKALESAATPLSTNRLLWRARWHMRRLKRDDGQIAARLLAEAEAEGADENEVLLTRLNWEAWRLWNELGVRADIERLRRQAVERRDIDPYDCRTHFLCGVCDLWLGQHAAAMAHFEQAIELNPSMSNGFGQLGSCHALAGHPDRALPLLETALRLNPLDTENFHQHGELAFAYLALDRHQAAVAAADRAIALRPGYVYAHVLKIAALSEAGDAAGAQVAREQLLRAKTALDTRFLDWLPFADANWRERLKAHLAHATHRP